MDGVVDGLAGGEDIAGDVLGHLISIILVNLNLIIKEKWEREWVEGIGCITFELTYLILYLAAYNFVKIRMQSKQSQILFEACLTSGQAQFVDTKLPRGYQLAPITMLQNREHRLVMGGLITFRRRKKCRSTTRRSTSRTPRRPTADSCLSVSSPVVLDAF